MKKVLKGYILGLLSAALLIGGTALAKSSTERIEVTYDNIKVYVDNVLTSLRDANGGTVEPFIYNGTTYIPVRGVSQALGCQVDWDGNTKSVYIWRENPNPNGTYLLEVCPPYEVSDIYNYEEYLQTEGKSFKMSGTSYTNGFTYWCNGDRYALFNLNGKYSTLDLTVGHVDSSNMHNATVAFVVDGKLIKEFDVEAEALPQIVSVPLNYGLQLKILVTSDGGTWNSPIIGFGNITIK